MNMHNNRSARTKPEHLRALRWGMLHILHTEIEETERNLERLRLSPRSGIEEAERTLERLELKFKRYEKIFNRPPDEAQGGSSA